MEYVGLRWYKCDFHLHTMNSKCYKEREKDVPEMWVKETENKGLQCIAITDHNDYRGIDEIKKLCEQAGIIAFPGVELSCETSKIHMLIIFDTKCSGDDVREYLNLIGIFKESLADSSYTCKGDIYEVCAKAREKGALVIAAHIDEFNGINEMSYDNIKKILDRKHIDAVQIVNKNIWDEYEKTHNEKEISEKLSEKYGEPISEDKVKSWHKAYSLAKNSELPMLTFSDNPCAENESKHGLWGIGRCYTWLKMNQTPGLESVRQALISYDLRTKNIFECSNRPDSEPELWIKSIKVSNTTLNNKNDINVNFNPQLNTIIGGRGSGKSSIIRTIAGALLSFDAEKLPMIKAEQDNFYKEHKKDKQGIFKGVFYSSKSKIEIYLERAGDYYKLVISNIVDMNNQLRKLYKYYNNEWVEIEDNNYLTFFKAQIYTQKQIYEIALDSNSLLNIIDEDIDDLNQKISEKDTALDKVIAKWLEVKALKKSINEEDKINTELKDIEEQISKYEASGISAALKEKQKYTSQKKIIDDYFVKKNAQIERITNSINELVAEKLACSELENQEAKSIIEKDINSFNIYKKSILDIIALMNKDTAELKESIEKSSWKKQMESAEKQYTEVCTTLQEQGINFDKLDDLLERKRNKLSDLDKIKEDKKKLVSVETEQKQLYTQYESIVKEIAILRSEFIKGVIGKDTNVKFEIQRGRNHNSFIQMMKNVLQKDNVTIDEDINNLADLFFEKDGIEKFRKKMWDIREENDKKSYSSRMRTAIVEIQPESFARMISFLPEDDLKVSYKPENAKNYIPLSNASAGQKTTAILTFLLAYGDLPLLLDQPEDDLDNKLVYDLIVTRLKKTKSKRQIIVVTHNANIPVNGDAEYIVSMNSETDEIDTKYEGTMDDEDIRKEICDVMEGTKDAFEMRAKKYHFKIVE